MGQLRDRMEADLRLGGYSPSTRKIYLLYARQFAKHYRRSPAEMGEDEIRAFLLHLVEGREVSSETYRQARAGLKFLYEITLRRPVDVAHLPSRRHPRRLPVVLSGSEVALVLKAVQSDKYRLILTAMYGAGLRVDEACRLQPENIDAKRRLLRIRGKGNRDRYTHRVALANHRIVEVGNGRVTFTIRDHAENGRRRSLALDTVEFLRRFLLHVLPKNLVRIRHYGLFAGRNLHTKLAAARRLLQQDTGSEPSAPGGRSTNRPWWRRFLELTGIDMMACPACTTGRLVRTGPLSPATTVFKPVRPPPPTSGSSGQPQYPIAVHLRTRG